MLVSNLWNRVARDRISANLVIGGVILASFVVIGLTGPWIAGYDPEEMHVAHLKESPSAAFPLGTDRLGRDVLSRLILGTRTTLVISVASTSLAMVLGVMLGSISAFFRGWIDNLIMRINDIFISFPTLVFALFVIGVFGPGIVNGIVVIGLMFAPSVARVTRSAAFNVVNLEYIDAAKIRGDGWPYIVFREILPNIYPTVIIEASIRLGYAILLSASLGYLGLGPPPPTPDWGQMVADERGYMLRNAWPVFAPCLAIVLSVIGVNLLGDGIKEFLVKRGSPRREGGAL